jgi:hypothetical protein
MHAFGFRRESQMARQPLRPGTPAPASAQYKVVGPRGGQSGKEITSIKGKPLPPAPQSGVTYKLTDRTHNKSGLGK